MRWRRSTGESIRPPGEPVKTPTAPGGDPNQQQRAPIALFRACLIAVCAVLSVLPPQHPSALAVLLPLAVGAWVAYRFPRTSAAWLYVAAVLASASVPPTGGARSPLLPYLLSPGLSLGLVGTPVDVVVIVGACAAALLVSGSFSGVLASEGFATVTLQWLLLSIGLGLVAVWARRLAVSPVVGRYEEARSLLRQLRNVTRRVPGGLDAPSAAQILLDRCAEIVTTARSAVLVQPSEDQLLPLAMRGANRVPWRTPLDEAGPLRDAWTSGRPVVDVRPPDSAGRRRGSTIAVVPFRADREPFGLVVLESFELDTFSAAVLADLAVAADNASLQLETALLFEEVRSTATMEERDRVAREMHDGVAQELAFVGYQLDDLRSRASKVDVDLASRAGELRVDVTRLISDIRVSITDLRSSLTSERGLGSALPSYLRAICTGKDIALHLSLQDSAFRLPAETEVALFRAMQTFTLPLRRRTQASNLWVELLVDPPSASLTIEHDGGTSNLDLDELSQTLTRLGGSVRVSSGIRGGPCLYVVIAGIVYDGQCASGRRPRIDPTGTAARLRAD